MNERRRLLTLALAAALAGLGCFKSSTIQASLESSSKSVSSPFKASSASSGGEGSSELARDVRDSTARYAREGGDLEAFRREVSWIAVHYGIADWEADAGVHVAMGEGLSQAGLDPDRAAAVGSELVAADPERLAAVLQGYRVAGGK